MTQAPTVNKTKGYQKKELPCLAAALYEHRITFTINEIRKRRDQRCQINLKRHSEDI